MAHLCIVAWVCLLVGLRQRMPSCQQLRRFCCTPTAGDDSEVALLGGHTTHLATALVVVILELLFWDWLKLKRLPYLSDP